MHQLWIDKNFAFDYLLKSILKVSIDKRLIIIVQSIRRVIKDFAMSLLAMMLYLVGEVKVTHPLIFLSPKYLNSLVARLGDDEGLEDILIELLTAHHKNLISRLTCMMNNESFQDKSIYSVMILKEFKKMKSSEDWILINNL